MKKQIKAENKVLGDKFEGYVGTLYQSLGYKVTYNVQLNGQQVDLLVEKNFPGAGVTKLVVECKYVTEGKISNQEVFNFMSVADRLLRNNGITKAVMIASTGFTEKSWAAAYENQFIELLSVRSLEDQLFDLGSTYRSFVETYESTDIFNEYVELNGVYYDGQKEKKRIKNIESLLTHWIKEPRGRYMTIFGDFGSGKTTMLSRLKYVIAKAYIEGRYTLKPFLVNLKDFYKYDTIDNY